MSLPIAPRAILSILDSLLREQASRRYRAPRRRIETLDALQSLAPLPMARLYCAAIPRAAFRDSLRHSMVDDRRAEFAGRHPAGSTPEACQHQWSSREPGADRRVLERLRGRRRSPRCAFLPIVRIRFEILLANRVFSRLSVLNLDCRVARLDFEPRVAAIFLSSRAPVSQSSSESAVGESVVFRRYAPRRCRAPRDGSIPPAASGRTLIEWVLSIGFCSISVLHDRFQLRHGKAAGLEKNRLLHCGVNQQLLG